MTEVGVGDKSGTGVEVAGAVAEMVGIWDTRATGRVVGEGVARTSVGKGVTGVTVAFERLQANAVNKTSTTATNKRERLETLIHSPSKDTAYGGQYNSGDISCQSEIATA